MDTHVRASLAARPRPGWIPLLVALSLAPAPAAALGDRAADAFQEARQALERGDCAEAVSRLQSVKGRRTRERAFVELLERARQCAERSPRAGEE